MLLWKRLDSQLLKKDLDYLSQKKVLTKLESMSKNPKEMHTVFLVRFSKVLTRLREAVSSSGTIQVSLPNMLAFYLVNGIRYACTIFVGILIDLQGDNYNSKA
mmetsp:Transcript_49551/g.59672  ORF Transcript_49551/g.59672 Transcript_49551/m.59672 type:complete len:103 (-) Transcript_49551:59-367(-)